LTAVAWKKLPRLVLAPAKLLILKTKNRWMKPSGFANSTKWQRLSYSFSLSISGSVTINSLHLVIFAAKKRFYLH
jgi:hypothetical protein